MTAHVVEVLVTRQRKTPPAGSGGAFRTDGHSSVRCWMLLLSEPTTRVEACYSQHDCRAHVVVGERSGQLAGFGIVRRRCNCVHAGRFEATTSDRA